MQQKINATPPVLLAQAECPSPVQVAARAAATPEAQRRIKSPLRAARTGQELRLMPTMRLPAELVNQVEDSLRTPLGELPYGAWTALIKELLTHYAAAEKQPAADTLLV